jgi:hypothetical protein
VAGRRVFVFYADPFIPALTLNDTLMESMNVVPETLQSMDCVVVLTDHSSFDYEMIATYSPLIVDCRNVLKNFLRSNIFPLGPPIRCFILQRAPPSSKLRIIVVASCRIPHMLRLLTATIMLSGC